MWYEIYIWNTETNRSETIYTCANEKEVLDYIKHSNTDTPMYIDYWKNPNNPEKVCVYNIVTCGNCGEILIHKEGIEEIKCTHCGLLSEPCDFPDLYY